MIHRVVRRVPVVPGLLWAAVLVGLAGCVPRDRVTASCAWREGVDALGPPGSDARRAHLTADVRLAQELGVRHADSAVGRPPPVMADWVAAERRCTAASLAAAARRHAADGVTRAELGALVGARDWWFDLLAIYLPVGALFVLLGRRVVARIVAGGDASGDSADLRVAAGVLALLTAVVALGAPAVTGMWAGTVEMLRLRNNHISYRGAQLPTSAHPWYFAAGAGVTFAALAVAELRRARRVAGHAARGRSRPPAGSVTLGLSRQPTAPRPERPARRGAPRS